MCVHIKNKSALITGAGGFLGREHADALLECDANVILTDVNLDMLEKNYNFLLKKYNDQKNELFYRKFCLEVFFGF